MIEMNDIQKFIPNSDLYTLIDQTSPSIVYIGQSKEPSPVTSDPVFVVKRISKIAGVTTIETANGGQASSVWDDRATIFPAVVLSNVYSTSFDGINDYANGGNIHNYDSASAFSVGIWIKPQNLAAQRCIFAKATNDANVYGYTLYHNNSGNIFLQMRSSGNNRQHTFSSTLAPQQWAFIVLTYDGGSNISGANVYIDGTKEPGPSAGALSGWLSGQDFNIGARNNTFHFSGNIDHVTVWDKELSQPEINELYNNGSTTDPRLHSASGNLISWYRMGDADVYPTISDNVSTNDLNLIGTTGDEFVEDVP